MKSMGHSLFLGVFICASISTVCADETPREAKPMMKGVELYSWRDETTKEWRFSFLPGTNRNKSVAEIIEPKTTIKTIEDLKTRLASLAVGEYVTWNSQADPKIFVFPPKDVLQQITALCKSKQINLRVKDE